jgi:hypothetical protein
MKTLERRRSRQRRKKELSWRRRITLPRPAACSRTIAASGSRPDAGSNPAAAAWTRAGSSRCARAGTGAGRSRSYRGRRGRRRLDGGRRRHSGCWLRRDDWFWRNNNTRGRIGGRSLELNELKSIAAGPAPAASRRTRTAATNRRRTLEIILRDRNENQENDERMHKERGGDTLPPPLSLAWYANRWPIGLSYWAGVSFGETPMTLTPAPRATSIAKITSEYLALGSPFTKMIFSGRGS